jgi:hypothetical protein
MKLSRTLLPVVLVVLLGSASQAQASPFREIVTATGAENGIGGNAAGTAFAQCPSGTQLVGGGGEFVEFSTNFSITRSLPLPEANGWIVTGRNWSGADSGLVARAQCGVPKLGGGLASTFAVNSSGSFTGGGGMNLESVGCPAGSQLLSGGGFWENFNQSLLGFVEDDPRGEEWTVVGRNWGSSGVKFFATALCGVPGPLGGFSGFTNVLGPDELIPHGQFGFSLGECGPGQQLLGPGGFWNAQLSQLSRNSGLSLIGVAAIGGDRPRAFAFEGGNMSTVNFGLLANGRCGS